MFIHVKPYPGGLWKVERSADWLPQIWPGLNSDNRSLCKAVLDWAHLLVHHRAGGLFLKCHSYKIDFFWHKGPKGFLGRFKIVKILWESLRKRLQNYRILNHLYLFGLSRSLSLSKLKRGLWERSLKKQYM